jgi:hypothetical protein
MLFVINVILGIGLLVSGRRLFWLFVAAAGFFTGVALVSRFWKGPEWLSIVVGLTIGVLFAVLAMALKSLAISLAGFLLGGAALLALASMLGFERGPFIWILYVVGGILGIILISAFFDWALIGISSAAGASILIQTLDFKRPIAGLGFIILLIIGLLIQSAGMRKEKKHDD